MFHRSSARICPSGKIASKGIQTLTVTKNVRLRHNLDPTFRVYLPVAVSPHLKRCANNESDLLGIPSVDPGS